MTKSAQHNTAPQYPTLFRRFAAWFYDALVVAAILMLAGGIAMALIALLLHFDILDISGHEDVSAYLTLHPLASSIYTGYLAAVIIGFYTYFWTHGGQTLGMRAWKLKLQNQDGSSLTTTQALIRATTSAFGLGNFMAFNTKRRALQDVMAECEMIVTKNVR